MVEVSEGSLLLWSTITFIVDISDVGEPQKCYCGEDCCSSYIGGVKNNAQVGRRPKGVAYLQVARLQKENPMFSDSSDDDMELDSDESGNEVSDKVVRFN